MDGFSLISRAARSFTAGSRAETAEEFVAAFSRALAEPGPRLIECVVPSVYSGRRLQALPYGLRALEKMPRPLARAIKRRMYP